MRDVLDLHTHTIASGHAYNTMMEMIHEAQNKGLDVYGITEHAPRMKGTCTDFYFHNLKVVPRKHGDLELLLTSSELVESYIAPKITFASSPTCSCT